MASLLRGYTLRATKLDGCGNPALGARSTVTTEGFVSVGVTANTDEGEPIQVPNARGKLCINDVPTPKFLNYGLEIVFCDVDPVLFTLLTGQPLVLDAQGNPTGFRINSKVDLDKSGFALELWTGVAGLACEPGQASLTGYMLFPFVKGGVLGDFSVENAAINFTITGAVTKDGSNWGVGPYDVQLDEDGVAGPLLEAADTADHFIHFPTSVEPPVAVQGGQALGVPATGAAQGTPATLSPTNSYAPENLAALIAGEPNAVVASPTTAWEAGRYILLADGSRARWTGTAWAAV